MGMARRVTKNHYVAPSPVDTESPTPVHVSRGHGLANRGYSTDGEDSQRAPSERTVSEYTSVPYTVVNERLAPVSSTARKTKSRTGSRAPSAMSHTRSSNFGDNNSDIYVTSAAYKAPSEISRSSRYSRVAPSHYSYRSGVAPSVASTAKTRTSRKAGMSVEAVAAPNPFCPNIRGMCCLMLLLNLGIILITLGFVIVIQFFEPLFVWVLGIVFLIFGFLTLIGSLIYCVVICREAPRRDEDLYWTHRWHKHIGAVPPPEIHYRQADKYHEDRYSDRYSLGKQSAKFSDRDSTRY